VFADEETCDLVPSSPASLKMVELATSQITNSEIAQSVWSCSKHFFEGAWKVSGGRAEDALECLSSPFDCADKAVTGVMNSWNFVSNLTQSLEKVKSALSNFSPGVTAELVCGLVGKLGVTVLMNVLSGGGTTAMTAKLIAGVTNSLSKIGAILRIAKKISPKKLLRLDEDLLIKAEELVKQGYSKLVKDAVEVCPL
jgi:hypothetical protein